MGIQNNRYDFVDLLENLQGEYVVKELNKALNAILHSLAQLEEKGAQGRISLDLKIGLHGGDPDNPSVAHKLSYTIPKLQGSISEVINGKTTLSFIEDRFEPVIYNKSDQQKDPNQIDMFNEA